MSGTREQRPWQVADQFQVTEPLRQRLGRALADVLDAKREQQALQRGCATGVDCRDQVVGPSGGDLLRVPFEAGRLCQRLRAPRRIVAIQLEHRIEHRAAAFCGRCSFSAASAEGSSASSTSFRCSSWSR